MKPKLYKNPDYQDLQKQVQEGNCVVFIGAGLSEGIYPGWTSLVKSLCQQCGIDWINSDQDENIKLLLDKADEAKVKNKKAYDMTLKKAFGPVVNKREAYELLMRLKLKFYVTTNFDQLLANETTKPEYSCSNIYRYPDLPLRRGRAVYYIHGMIKHDEDSEPNIILGKQDFDNAYSTSTTLYSFLHQVLTYETVLFVGCTLREPQLIEVFKICRQVRRELEHYQNMTAPNRYILLPDKASAGLDSIPMQQNLSLEEDETQLLKELDINTIRYDPKDKNFSGLEGILREWCKLPDLTISRGFSRETEIE